MARLRKSSVLVCLALLCNAAIGSKSYRDSSSASAFEESQSKEDSLPSPAVHSNDQGGLNIPVASGGVEPPSDYVPQLFVLADFVGLDQNNLGSFIGEGPPNVVPSQNTNFESSTGSFNGGSSQQPSTGSFGTPGSTNRFPSQNTKGGGQSYPEISTVANGIQVFTLNLLATLKPVSQVNVVYSPVSISSLLSLLTLATHGISKHEIEISLFPLTSSSSNDQHSQYEKLLERLNRISPGITISTSSKLFLEQTVTIFGTFSNAAKKHYNCNVSLENFSSKPEQAMQSVNSWVEKETRGKIIEFISQPFSQNTKFVAANTIYFKGEWATPFPEYFTAEKDFDTGNEIVQIPMMTNVFETPHYYSKEFNADVASLPYRGGEFAMIIILPRESPSEKSIIDLEKQLNTSTIDSLVNSLTSKSVSISLPKMKLAMKTSLVENLSELGIRSIFSPSTADFSGLSNTKPLWVSQLLHEAVMEVTEEGTVAAGVSASSLDRIGGYQRINVDKPAIIFIRDMVTRVPLFWTRLVKPERVPESGQNKAQSPTKY